MLSLNRLSLCGGTSLLRLSGAFLSFSLSTLGLGGLLISRRARTFGLDRTASGLLAKLAGLLATTFVTPATRGASDEGNQPSTTTTPTAIAMIVPVFTVSSFS